jgi:hypothetical protein
MQLAYNFEVMMSERAGKPCDESETVKKREFA